MSHRAPTGNELRLVGEAVTVRWETYSLRRKSKLMRLTWRLTPHKFGRKLLYRTIHNEKRTILRLDDQTEMWRKLLGKDETSPWWAVLTDSGKLVTYLDDTTTIEAQ